MTIVAAVKYILVFTLRPVVNMWCAHTTNPTTPIATIAYAMPRKQKTGLRLNVEMIWLTMPKPGRIMM